MVSRSVPEALSSLARRIKELERASTRPKGRGVINDPDNPLLHLDGGEGFRTVSGGSSNGNHWAKIATFRISARYHDTNLLFTATPRDYSGADRIPSFIFARVKQQNDFGSNPTASITIYPGGTHPTPENLRLVVLQNTPSTVAEIYLKLDSYTGYGIKPIHSSGNILNVEWHHNIPSVVAPPAGIISLTATYAQIDPSAIPDTGWVNLSLVDGWTNSASNPMQVRKVGNLVELRGRVHQGTGTTVFNLAQEFRPTQQRVFALDEGLTNGVARMAIEADGRTWLAGRSGSTAVITFAGVTYFSG